MQYKVLIQKCTDPVQLDRVAAEIAAWSGSPLDVVKGALSQKPVCIRKDAEEAEARDLKARFEAAGAQVELAPVALTAAPKTHASHDDDDDDDVPGRTLSDAEYLKVLQSRADIFYIENDNRIKVIQIGSVLIGLIFGVWISNMQLNTIKPDFFEKIKTEQTGKFVTEAIDATLEKKEEEKAPEQKVKDQDETKMVPSKNKGNAATSSGGGDPRARVTRQGVLGIISGAVKGKAVASADIFGKGGFATGIDAVLSGVGGLKAGGGGGVGRKGAAGIGYGAGYGSGFGGGSGGIDDLVGSLMGGGGGGLALKGSRGPALKMTAPEFEGGAALTGGRSKASIQRVVMQNMNALRYAYNKRLRENPDLKGKLTIKFAIDEFGKVIFCQLVNSSMSNPELEQEIVEKIKRWVFDKIDKPGDVTEVTYPFVFSP